MNERQYNLLEINYIKDQYDGFTQYNPEMGFVEYIQTIYDKSTMQENFEQKYSYLKQGLLENVIDGE